MNTYSAFASVYDRLTDNVEYIKRAAYLHDILSKNGVNDGATVLDLACGTGNLTLELAEYYDMLGVDISADMLSFALNKMYKSKKEILFLRQDMTKLDLYGTIDAAVCTLDSLNHLDSEESVEETIKRVGLFMNPGGIFVFDVNTVYKHREILKNNTFVYDCDDVYCVWQNTLNEDDSVEICLDIFEEHGGVYLRSGETFTERAYPIEKYRGWLQNAEFKIINIFDEMTQNNITDETQRAVFVARYTGKSEENIHG